MLVLAILLGLISYTAKAQGDLLTVKGTVKEAATGNPLPGVKITGGRQPIATTVDGTFSVQVRKGGVLTFSSIGYENQLITVNTADPLQVVLAASKTALNEVVVVGYGTQRKAVVSGAVSTIQAADLERTPAVTTSNALTGIQGVNLRSVTGRPGSSTTVQIRNMGTPLYVIDGIPQSEGQFNEIGLEDIESISILKDASAAIYGFRASNGVVLVTTKKGKNNEKSTLSVSSYYGLQDVSRYITPANAYEYERALDYADQNAGNTPTVSADILQKWKDGTEPGYQSTNYRDVILLKNVPQSYLNMNASGATDKMNYYFSISDLDQEAVLKQYNFTRQNFQANMEGTINKYLKVGANLSGRIESRHNVASTTTPSVTYDNPFLAILTMWPTEHMYANDNPNYINANINNPSRNPLIYDQNVVGSEDNIWNNFASIFYATVTLPFGLTAKATYSYNYKQNKNELFRKNFTTYSYVPATGAYLPDPFTLALRDKYREEIKENFAQFQLTYTKAIRSHHISALAAYEYQASTDGTLDINSIPPTNVLPIINQTEITTFSNTETDSKRASFIGKFDYDYQSKYLLELLGRYDGTSLYTDTKRFGFFPGVTGGWRVSEEKFIKDKFPIISNLKLRASWGRTGSEQGVNPYAYLDGGSYGSGSYVFDPGKVTTGIAARGLPVTNITWVTSTSINFGVDVGILNNKLTGEFDVFQRKLTGIAASRYDVLIPSEVGYTLPLENLNSEATKGIEAKITWATTTGKVSYSISGNATLARREILDLYKPRYGSAIDEYRNRTANRFANIYWGYEAIGQFQSVDQIKKYNVDNDNQGNRTELPGDIIFKDQNGDGIINTQDERPIGYNTGATPYLTFGLNTSVSYKGFSLMTDWAGATMQSYYRALETQIPFQANHNAPEYLFTNVWHREDVFDPNSAWIPGDYPAVRKATPRTYTATSSFWMKNVTYLRLKNLQLGYTFSSAMLSKVHISKLRVYFTGTNMFSFDNVKDIGIDPEISFNSGLVYPNLTVYTIGMNLTL
jgi:TonB-linked SusC/RagA family outer membrane protein